MMFEADEELRQLKNAKLKEEEQTVVHKKFESQYFISNK